MFSMNFFDKVTHIYLDPHKQHILLTITSLDVGLCLFRKSNYIVILLQSTQIDAEDRATKVQTASYEGQQMDKLEKRHTYCLASQLSKCPQTILRPIVTGCLPAKNPGSVETSVNELSTV